MVSAPLHYLPVCYRSYHDIRNHLLLDHVGCVLFHSSLETSPEMLCSASSVANLALYASLPLHRQGLIISLVPLLRTVMSVSTARLILNLRHVAVNNGLHGRHWALGELGDDVASSSALSRTMASSTAVASYPGKRSSLLVSGGSRSLQGPGNTERNIGDSLRSTNHSRLGSPMPPIVVSVHTVEEEHRDDTPAEVSQPSSFRMSVLNRFTNIAGLNTNPNIELGELRANGQSHR